VRPELMCFSMLLLWTCTTNVSAQSRPDKAHQAASSGSTAGSWSTATSATICSVNPHRHGMQAEERFGVGVETQTASFGCRLTRI